MKKTTHLIGCADIVSRLKLAADAANEAANADTVNDIIDHLDYGLEYVKETEKVFKNLREAAEKELALHRGGQ